MIQIHTPGMEAQHVIADDLFARISMPDLLDGPDTPYRVKGVVDIEGHPAPTFGTALLTNGTLGADVLDIPPYARFPLHTHPGHHLLYCLRGTGTFTLAGVVHTVHPGDLMMVEGQIPHAVGAGPDGHTILAIGSPHTHVGSPNRMTVVLEDDDECAAAIRAVMEAEGVRVVTPEAAAPTP